MFTPRLTMFIGLTIGAVWAVTGFDGALLTLALGAVGLFVGLVLSQGIDLGELTRRSDDE